MVAIGLHHYLCKCYNTSLHGNIKIAARKHFQVVMPILHSHTFKLDGIFARPDHNGKAAINIGRCTFCQIFKIYSGSNHGIASFHICDLSMQYRHICSLSFSPGSNMKSLQHSCLSAINIFLLRGCKTSCSLLIGNTYHLPAS